MHGQLTCFLELLRSNAKRDITSFNLIDSPSLLPLFSSLKLLFLYFFILFPFLLSVCFTLPFSSCHYLFSPLLFSPFFILSSPCYFTLFSSCHTSLSSILSLFPLIPLFLTFSPCFPSPFLVPPILLLPPLLPQSLPSSSFYSLSMCFREEVLVC